MVAYYLICVSQIVCVCVCVCVFVSSFVISPSLDMVFLREKASCFIDFAIAFIYDILVITALSGGRYSII